MLLPAGLLLSSCIAATLRVTDDASVKGVRESAEAVAYLRLLCKKLSVALLSGYQLETD